MAAKHSVKGWVCHDVAVWVGNPAAPGPVRFVVFRFRQFKSV